MSNTQSVMFVTKRPDIEMVSGQGSWLVDNHGKRYLDFLQGWAVNCLGHSDPGMLRESVTGSLPSSKLTAR